MIFTLTIELGNDAMQTSEDLERALFEVGRRIGRNGYVELNLESERGTAHTRSIQDLKGNTVGEWTLRKMFEWVR
jgi:hypothetical protein